MGIWSGPNESGTPLSHFEEIKKQKNNNILLIKKTQNWYIRIRTNFVYYQPIQLNKEELLVPFCFYLLREGMNIDLSRFIKL